MMGARLRHTLSNSHLHALWFNASPVQSLTRNEDRSYLPKSYPPFCINATKMVGRNPSMLTELS